MIRCSLKTHKLVKGRSEIRAMIPMKCFLFLNAAIRFGVSVAKHMELI